MNGYKKIIKYFAIAIASALAVSIISSVVYGVGGLISLLDTKKEKNVEFFDKNGTFEVANNINILDIEVDNVDIVMEVGKDFKIATDNDDITYRENGNKLVISGKEASIFNKRVDGSVIIYVPEDIKLDEIEIENGVGKVVIDSISTEKIEMELGLGKLEINNLNVLSNMSVDGGAGEIVISDSSINNLNLDMGVGSVTLNSKLLGNNEINAGVGQLKLDLIGDKDDYSVHINKGIGSALIEGDSVSDDISYGNGMNRINIDGGVGNISVDFLG